MSQAPASRQLRGRRLPFSWARREPEFDNVKAALQAMILLRALRADRQVVL